MRSNTNSVTVTSTPVTAPSPSTIRAWRHSAPAVLTAAYVVAFAVFLVLHGGEDTRRIEDILFLPLYLVAGLSVWRGAPALSSGREWRERVGWRLIGMAWVLSCIAALGWVVVPGSVFVDIVADALYTAYYPLLVAGFTLLAVLPATDRARLRLLLETLIVLVAALTFARYFATAGTASLSRIERFIGLGELTSFGEIWVLVAGSIALHGRPRASRRPALQLLTLGAFVAAVSDLMLGYLDRNAQHTQRQVAVLILAVAATLFVIAGAVNRRVPDRLGRLDTGAWLPYSAIAVLGALLIREILRPTQDFQLLAVLVLGGILLTTLVLGRLLLAEQAVREEYRARVDQDARYRALIQRSREALLVVDVDGILRYASAASASILGWDPTAVVGRQLATLLDGTESRPLSEALHTPGDGRVVIWSLQTERGLRELETVISDLRDDAAVQGLVLNTRDVTERTALELKLRRSQKLDALGLLAGGVAHDFNNILTVIRGTAELVAFHGLSHPAEEMRQIQLASDRGAALCRQLLTFGRADVVRNEVLDLGELTRGVIPMLVRVLPAAVKLEAQTAAGPLSASCDRAQLEIAILNLVMNSRDALPDGGVIRVTTALEEVTGNTPESVSEGVPNGRYATIAVADSGTGMDEQTRARALDPFFTTKATGAGTGLGLSTVFGVVTAADGFMRLRSALGEGTTITLLFPLASAPIAAPVRAVQADVPSSQSVVLVVDDERELRGAIARYLTSMGYLVHQAGDGVDAIEQLDTMTAPPDAVVSDITMPRMNGVSLARTLRDRYAALPIILISGNMGVVASEPEVPEAVDFLSKPFGFAALESLISRRLHQRK